MKNFNTNEVLELNKRKKLEKWICDSDLIMQQIREYLNLKKGTEDDNFFIELLLSFGQPIKAV